MKKSTSIPIPRPVTVSTLRNHFKTTYQFKEDQVELMIRSSKKSLNVTLSAAHDALQVENVYGLLGSVGHNLKGLFLNMGEPQWAEVARDLEVAAKAGEERGCAAIIDKIIEGMAAVTGYAAGHK